MIMTIMNVTRIAAAAVDGAAAAAVVTLAIGNGELTKESVYNRTFVCVCVGLFLVSFCCCCCSFFFSYM